MQDFVITAAGQELMAKMIAGTSTCIFLKICTSEHDYSGVDLGELSELQKIKQTTLISSITRTDNTIVNLMAMVDNSQLAVDYYIRAIGLYAKDANENEILYAVSIETDHPDHLPAFSGKTISSITYSMNIRVDNSSQVVLEVNPLGIPTIEQVQSIQRSINTHAALSVYTETGVHGFRFWNGNLQIYNAETAEWEDASNKTVVDSALSATSENSVQNKVVDAAIKALGAAVIISDTAPSQTDNVLWVQPGGST